ncbi:hypothetical protein U1Q18_039754 [Sarracenia purpurea var. burkii]
MDLWVDDGIESPAVLGSVRRALAFDSDWWRRENQQGMSGGNREGWRRRTAVNPTMERYTGDSKWWRKKKFYRPQECGSDTM